MKVRSWNLAQLICLFVLRTQASHQAVCNNDALIVEREILRCCLNLLT